MDSVFFSSFSEKGGGGVDTPAFMAIAPRGLPWVGDGIFSFLSSYAPVSSSVVAFSLPLPEQFAKGHTLC